jgi:hypothetical protein
MPIGYRAEITPPLPTPARLAPSRRTRLKKAFVLLLMTVPALAAWRELEPLLRFRPDNPVHPAEAVIDRNPNPIWLSILAMVGVFAGIFWMSIGASERKRRAARTPESRQDIAA